MQSAQNIVAPPTPAVTAVPVRVQKLSVATLDLRTPLIRYTSVLTVLTCEVTVAVATPAAVSAALYHDWRKALKLWISAPSPVARPFCAKPSAIRPATP